MADFLGDVAGDLFGDLVAELVVKPLHWIAWATGAAVVTLGSFGRFQIEPFNDDEWFPKEERPILHTFGATLIGSGIWAILVAALVRAMFF